MNTLGIFVKYPQAGQVKTRLGRTLGAKAAAEVYAAFVGDLLDRMRCVADHRILAYAPQSPEACAFFTDLAGGDFELWPQPDGGLGARMRAFFDASFAGGAEQVVLIGSDAPDVPVGYINQAFTELRRTDCVLGPAVDGGFYLIGQPAPGRAVFTGIDWSGVGVLDQTVQRIAALGASLELLPPWYDIDTADDLRMLRGHLAAGDVAGRPPELPRTREVLQRLQGALDRLDHV